MSRATQLTMSRCNCRIPGRQCDHAIFTCAPSYDWNGGLAAAPVAQGTDPHMLQVPKPVSWTSPPVSLIRHLADPDGGPGPCSWSQTLKKLPLGLDRALGQEYEILIMGHQILTRKKKKHLTKKLTDMLAAQREEQHLGLQ